jgi:hypothetical protein
MDQEMGNAPASEPAASSGMTPLNDVFGRSEPAVQAREPEGQPEPAIVPQAQPETGDEPKVEQPRDERGKFAPKQNAAPPAEKDPEQGRIAALKAERDKRQALERELQELRARMAAPPAQPVQQAPRQPATPPVPLADLMFQDPEKFVAALQQRQEEQLLTTRIATSEAMARQQPDYDAAEQALTAYAQSSPQAEEEVRAKLRSHPAPAMWAYQAGKHLLSQQRWQPIMQQHSDPEAYIAAEVERRLQERQAEQQPVTQAPAPPRLPTSLATTRAAGPRTGPGWAGPTPLNNVFGRNG